jgi:hypothetical protein
MDSPSIFERIVPNGEVDERSLKEWLIELQNEGLEVSTRSPTGKRRQSRFDNASTFDPDSKRPRISETSTASSYRDADSRSRKSTPCIHFRKGKNGCLRGDSCPYKHIL